MAKEEAGERLSRIRHSMAHVMAEAVLQMFPTAQIAIGPAIENGFYYDFDLPRQLVTEDLEEISERMRAIISEDKPFVRTVVSRAEAQEKFAGQVYKQELLQAIPEDEEVSLYNQGGFTDLCRGPHVETTKELKGDAFKLMSIAGAYWRGKETNPMLTRIYGTAWSNAKELRLYLQHLEDVEKRDHRKLGKELDLFSLHEEAGPGLVYWHRWGAKNPLAIETFLGNEHYANGYEMCNTPPYRALLALGSQRPTWVLQGRMYPFDGDGQERLLCQTDELSVPHHDLQEQQASYRDLPVPLAELELSFDMRRLCHARVDGGCAASG